MKKRTWIISALMYAMVFAACFGVLHVLDRITRPADRPAAATETMESNAPSAEETRHVTERETEGIKPEETETQSTENMDPLHRESGYTSWKKRLEGAWSQSPAEEPYTPPKIILATDLHYQSAACQDDGEAFQTFVAESDGKVIQYLPELLEAFIDQVIA